MSAKRKIIGELMKFTGIGLDYCPVNEQGVIFIFAKLHQQLGIDALQCIQETFPDAIGRRKIGKEKFTEVNIEFEYRSSGFKEHIKKDQYDGQNCHIVVCWEHDWKEIPKELEVIELKSIISELYEKGKLPKKIKELSEKEKEYLEFFGDLLNKFKARIPDVTQQKPLPYPWCCIPIGISGVHLEWSIYKRPTPALFVGLHMERTKKEENEKLFKYLKSQEEDLRKELGSDLYFQYPWGKRWARIFKKRNYNPENKNDVEKIKKWGLETMIRFYNTFKTRISKFRF